MSKITPVIQFITKRSISVSAPREGKRNFRKFPIPNKRGSRIFKQRQFSANPELPVDKRGVRDTGYILNGRFVSVPEMIPEIVVPDLKDCDLKPYVSYKAKDVTQPEFTAQDLFNVVYAKKIAADFKSGKLDADGNPLEPSEEEKLQPEEAVSRAKRTGSDIF